MERVVNDIPEMYSAMMTTMHKYGVLEDSRNGPVKTIQEPLLVRVTHPTHRVLFDPVRDANPFFHLMEFVWMMSGDNHPDWIALFNKRFYEYADKDSGIIHGAYGHRWRNHFYIDQIAKAIEMLGRNHSTRRVVIQMWDPRTDLGAERNDLPCNTELLLRVVNGALNMTVVNRSNDVLWGMVGANCVHMTMLQEYIASAIKARVGEYSVLTINAHVYTEVPGFDTGTMLETRLSYYPPEYRVTNHPQELMGFGENHVDFIDLCTDIVNGGSGAGNDFLHNTARVMRDIYLERKAGNLTTEEAITECQGITCPHWRVAATEWLKRRLK